VDSELKLLYVFNYPNPFSKETYFTFKLTQIPDELKIRIFTLAGRLIKEFVLMSADLRCDFNRILWNGRDQDGDKIANGVYLYKIVTSKNGSSTSVTQKLAVIR
jgi:flagellar hook assembly protein FlgD